MRITSRKIEVIDYVIGDDFMQVTRVFNKNNNFNVIFYGYINQKLDEIITDKELFNTESKMIIVPHISENNECEVN
jgi:hypothetical protein